MDRPPDAQPRTWRKAMSEALYGPAGFYRSSGAPGRGFRTAAHASPLWATAIHRLAHRVDDDLGNPRSFTIVEVGAGGGELLTGLAGLAPERWTLVGVDVAPRPADLPARVTWSDKAPRETVGLVIAAELLDVVPVDVAELSEDGIRLVEVFPDGSERATTVPSNRDSEWLARWWRLAEVGDRAEVGWPRDDRWRSLIASLQQGVAVAIDYAADPARDLAGTLTGFRNGHQISPVADGSCDLTAHVCFESLRKPGDLMTTQRDALRELGVTGERPAYAGDPTGYLTALAASGEAAELLDGGGLGGFTWLLHAAGVPQPLTIPAGSAGARQA